MRIVFARHGQTDWNVLGKVQGTTDIVLNDTGIQQAMKLCDNLQKIKVHPYKVYTSYQNRAIKTAQIVSEKFQVPVEIIKGLEEMNLGDFEGHTWDEIHRLYPKELEYWSSNKRYNKTPNGESYQMVLERLFQALDSILEQVMKVESENKDVLIVSHGAVILTLLALQNDIPFEQSHKIAIENAEPLEFSLGDLNEIRKKGERSRQNFV